MVNISVSTNTLGYTCLGLQRPLIEESLVEDLIEPDRVPASPLR